MWRLIFALPLLVHGLAHLSGFLAAYTAGELGFRPQAWLLSGGVTIHSPTGKAFGLLWLLAMLGFVGAALGVFFQQAWWPALALAAAAVSLVVIVPWWNTIPPGARVGAAFDVLIWLLLASPLRDPLLAQLA